MKRKGFTLIELLVVIAVIGILVGILLPVLAQAKKKANRAVCSRNCKTMAEALENYVQDYGANKWAPADGTPTVVSGATLMIPDKGSNRGPNFLEAMRYDHLGNLLYNPALRDPRCYTCPASDDKMTTETDESANIALGVPAATGVIVSYAGYTGYPGAVNTDTYTTTEGAQILTSSNSSTTIICADRINDEGGGDIRWTYTDTTWSTPPVLPTTTLEHTVAPWMTNIPRNHDGEGINVGYGDGRVEWASETTELGSFWYGVGHSKLESVVYPASTVESTSMFCPRSY